MGLRSLAKDLLPQRHPLRSLYHRMRGTLAAFKAGFPQNKLRIIGITGTDGKTTTVGMIAHILRVAGKTVGASSTTFFRINDDIQWNETHKTSVDPAVFQNFLLKCVAAQCEFAVVEASSHGLVQGRLGPIHSEIACITNTSLEHLDYHGTMEQYRKDKAILFRRLKATGTKVINATDESASVLLPLRSARTVAFSTDKKPHCATDRSLWTNNVRVKDGKTMATLHFLDSTKESTAELVLAIPGTYNIENGLCALSATLEAGVSLEDALRALTTFPGIPGRLERIDDGQAFSVYVDFTVTPQAYERALGAVRAMHPDGRLLVLTGSCGDRMKEKRPVIGEICSRLADVVVVTTDETLKEDPLSVIEDVWAGVDKGAADAEKIPDRRTAIRTLLAAARPGDAVILCGMGACQSMQTQTGLIPWDEREVARDILRQLKTT